MPTRREEELQDARRYRQMVSDGLPQTTRVLEERNMMDSDKERMKESEMHSFIHAANLIESRELGGEVDHEGHSVDDRLDVEAGYKGIQHEDGRWWVRIKVDNRLKVFGPYQDKHRAAKAWNEAARTFWGKFSGLNDTPDRLGSNPQLKNRVYDISNVE